MNEWTKHIFRVEVTDLAHEKPKTGEEPDSDLSEEEDEVGDGLLGISSDDKIAVVVKVGLQVNKCFNHRGISRGAASGGMTSPSC